MAEDQAQPDGPDLAQGIALAELPDGGKLVGHVGQEPVLLVRRGADIFAVGAQCTHYSGPLAEGLLVEETVRCPWHHACFDLRTGEALRAPALSPVSTWRVEQRDGKIFVREKRARPEKQGLARKRDEPKQNRDRRRRRGGVRRGRDAAPAKIRGWRRHAEQRRRAACRPAELVEGLSRRQRARGMAAAARRQSSIPTIPSTFGSIRPSPPSTSAAREVALAGRETLPFDRLLLATGAEPVSPSIPGAKPSDVLVLRTLKDCRAIIERAKTAKRVVVLGASFIGLEVAASLRARNIEVHVVAPEERPMEKILGPDFSRLVQAIHEQHDVVFHFQNTVSGAEGKRMTLSGGAVLEADFIVAGLGVRPRLSLAEAAGLNIDRGVAVDAFLETSAPGIFAAGDIARWPDRLTGDAIRVEHWVVAERQGQAAALNMLGRREPFDAVPFFWSQHYDVPINYVGHAEKWDDLVVEGDIQAKDGAVRMRRAGRTLAVATVFRDLASLEAEVSLEREARAGAA